MEFRFGLKPDCMFNWTVTVHLCDRLAAILSLSTSRETVAPSRNKVLEMLLEKLTKMLRPYCQDCPAIQQLSGNFLKWARHSVAKGTLCSFSVVWKLHKGANSRGVRSRPIAPNIGYTTGQISQFLQRGTANWSMLFLSIDSS